MTAHRASQSCLAFLLFASLAQSRGWAFEDQPLVFLGDKDYAPLSYLENGTPKGLDIDILQAVGRALGRPVRIELVEWRDAQRRVLLGEADALTDLGETEERRRLYDFTEPTATHEWGLFVRSDNAVIRGPSDLSGHTVGVTPGGFPQQFLAAQTAVRQAVVNDYEDGFSHLAHGTIDAFVTDVWGGAYYSQQRRLPNIGFAGTLATSAATIAVRKGNPALVAELNRAIRSLKADGTLARIHERWRPLEVVFISRERVRQIITEVGAGLAVVLLGAMGLWVGTLKKQIRVRRLAEDALRASEEKFAKAFRSSPDCVAISDLGSGVVLEINEQFERITGYARSQIIGRSIEEIGLLVDSAVRDVFFASLRRDGRVRDFEFKIRRKSGEIATIVASAEVIEIGGRRCFIKIARDVTTHRELEAQLRQSQKMDAVGQLAAGVAHDFNNLLTLIMGHCEVAAPLLASHASLGGTFADIRAAAERAAALTGQLLAFSRRQMIQPRIIDLNDVIGDIRRMLARLIGEHIELQFDPGANLGYVKADPSQLQQVVMNLSVNARDAMPDGGRLCIETRAIHLDDDHLESSARMPAGDYVVLSVSDAGVGMDERTRDRIFEPFFTTKELGKGTGLGLATVYGIVKQSRGFIFVTSEVGRGTTFRIYLPQMAMPESRPLAGASFDHRPRGHETVLLVEDEYDVRELLREYLVGCGYTVLSASNGEEGLALCRAQPTPPVLVVTDVVMPGMGGRALADELRATYLGMKVLYLSGYSDDAILTHGTLPVGTHFLQKPFALSALAGTIRDIIDRDVV